MASEHDKREWRLRRRSDGPWTVDLQRHPSRDNERVVTAVPKSRAVAAEAERDALRGLYDGLVTQMQAVLKAIVEVAPGERRGVHPALNHLAGMAQAMRNYIEADAEELSRAASVSKEETRDG